MENGSIKKAQKKQSRALRVRKRLRGNREKPRLCVLKSNAHIHMQLIDDEAGITLASVSTNAKEFRGQIDLKRDKASGKFLGEKMAEKAKTLQVEKIVFDRGAHKYHGILSEIAQSMRNQGLQF